MWVKDPDETLNYKFDWAPATNGEGADTDWLDLTSSPQEKISSHTISTDSPGPTIESSSLTDSNTSVTLSVSGGTSGQKYQITCEIVTSSGQTAQRTEILQVLDR